MAYTVYLLTNAISGKIYVGYTKGTPEWRFSLHVRAAKEARRHTYHLALAIRKYGPASFIVCPLAEAGSEIEAKRLEVEHIARLRANDRAVGYNMTLGGEGGISEEVRAKLSKANLGKRRTDRMRKLLSESRSGPRHPCWGKKRPPSVGEKISVANRGKFSGPESPVWRDLPLERIREMYLSGMSGRSIGKVFDVSDDTVIGRLKALGVERRPRWQKALEGINADRRVRSGGGR